MKSLVFATAAAFGAMASTGASAQLAPPENQAEDYVPRIVCIKTYNPNTGTWALECTVLPEPAPVLV